jgi:hypothetical protein
MFLFHLSSYKQQEAHHAETKKEYNTMWQKKKNAKKEPAR